MNIHVKKGLSVRLILKGKKKYVLVKFSSLHNKGIDEIEIPMSLIDKIKEDEWVYDCGHNSARKS